MERQPSSSSHEPTYASATAEDALPRFTGVLRPAVDAVAALRWPVRRKLLAGFLTGAVLLVAMGALSLVVMDQMNDRRLEFEQAQHEADLARQMLYEVTAQSHYRAMALLLSTEQGASARYTAGDLTRPEHYVEEFAEAKRDFANLLDEIETVDPKDKQVFEDLEAANQDYAASGRQVSKRYGDHDVPGAITHHILGEHVKSHKLENQLNAFVDKADSDMAAAQADFESSHQLHTIVVVAFSALSVLAAMTLGFIFSWAFILPVRKVQGALAELSNGRFPGPVTVPNRDEFGSLTRDLNATSDRLHGLFSHQRDLTAELRRTNATLVRASEAKSQLLASVSHELRTPLNSVLGFTGTLLAGVDGPLNQEQKASLGWVERGGNDLLNLIDELLDLSRIEAGKLTLAPAPFQPIEMVEAVVAQHRSMADQKGIGLSYQDAGSPVDVVQDPQRVRQVLANLIGNAVKLTEEGGVEVTGSTTADGLRVAVRDSGPGIPEREREAIFEDFYQAHGSERGTGLGLAISRRLARAMGGDVTLQTRVGYGSTFQLWLPRDYETLTHVGQKAVTRSSPEPPDSRKGDGDT